MLESAPDTLEVVNTVHWPSVDTYTVYQGVQSVSGAGTGTGVQSDYNTILGPKKNPDLSYQYHYYQTNLTVHVQSLQFKFKGNRTSGYVQSLGNTNDTSTKHAATSATSTKHAAKSSATSTKHAATSSATSGACAETTTEQVKSKTTDRHTSNRLCMDLLRRCPGLSSSIGRGGSREQQH